MTKLVASLAQDDKLVASLGQDDKLVASWIPTIVAPWIGARVNLHSPPPQAPSR
ncbi:MAG: hypothetical protein ABI625_03165 [bacterium]